MIKWEKAKRNQESGMYSIPETWLFIHYYEAINLLFRIENSLRLFVYSILKNELKDTWRDVNINSDDSGSGSLEMITRQRLSQSKNFGYLCPPINSPIMFLTSGELIRIITAETNWKYFKNHFSCKKEIVKYKLDEIGIIRNSLAHFRPITEGDVDLLKQNTLHIFDGIDKYIDELLTVNTFIPTNTEDSWYKKLNTIATTEEFYTKCFQSTDNSWIKINMNYKCPIIKRPEKLNNWSRIVLLNCKTSPIITNYENIKKNITYLTESINASSYDDNISVTKCSSLIFNKKTLSVEIDSIVSDIGLIIAKINDETDKVKSDQYVKGTFIESVDTYLTKNESPFLQNFDIESKRLLEKLDENSEIEFWGNYLTPYYNFITDSNIYPWMNKEVSHDPIPF